MFVLGFILGLAVAAGVVWLLAAGRGTIEESELPLLLARRQIGELERQTIAQMLAEARASVRRETSYGSDVIEVTED